MMNEEEICSLDLIPEEVRFHIAEYGSSYDISNEMWLNQIRLLDPSFDLGDIASDLRKWHTLQAEYEKSIFYPVYMAIKGKIWEITIFNGFFTIDPIREFNDALNMIIHRRGLPMTIQYSGTRTSRYYTVRSSHRDSARFLAEELISMDIHACTHPLDPHLFTEYERDEGFGQYADIVKFRGPIGPRCERRALVPYNDEMLKEVQKLDPSFSLENHYRKLIDRIGNRYVEIPNLPEIVTEIYLRNDMLHVKVKAGEEINHPDWQWDDLEQDYVYVGENEGFLMLKYIANTIWNGEILVISGNTAYTSYDPNMD